MAKSATKEKKSKGGGPETMPFQAEVSRLLDIVAHSLYSDREIFLRELISNASDACDRLRYAALTDAALAKGAGDYHIEIRPDKDAKTLGLTDNGIGMDHDELVENLGTIARSGTAAFVEKLSDDSSKDFSLIGQFGVGFYSAFMVADEVTVTTRRAGTEQGWRWTSDGKGSFTIEAAEREAPGTTVTLHLREDAGEFLEPARLRQIVKTYSDHIPVAIRLVPEDGAAAETINQASALWTRPRNSIDEQQYKEFYHHVAHAMDDPWHTMHFRAEGVIEYTGLLFIPSTRPFDIFHPDRKSPLKLYVRRVFITDDCPEVIPAWLRFLRGVIDSEDLDLNVSREMLQKNPVLAKIKSGLTKRVLGELQKKAESDADAYATFWDNFGAVVKEGLYEDFAYREDLLKVVRFRSTNGDGLVSLANYVARMKEGQTAIYYISGEDMETVTRSPQLEGFRKRGVEVLLLTDPVDEFWIPSVGVFDGKPFKSVTRAGADLSSIKSDGDDDADTKDEAAKTDGKALGTLIALLKTTLGDAVKDVRESSRLTTSAVCLVSDENDIDMRLEKLLRQHKQLDQSFARILEINPDHALIRSLAEDATRDGVTDRLADAAFLLLDQARLLEGEALPDPQAFARRLESMISKGIGAPDG
jgi:molecular chaperone HtpG